MSMRRAGRGVIILAIVVAFVAAPAAANDTLEEAKKLYEATLFENALAVLANLDSAEALKYRALCLLALNRHDEAEKTIESLIAAAPAFAPSSEEHPPRFMTLFASTRRRFLPTRIRALFTDARQQFQEKSFSSARDRFGEILALKGDPDVKDVPEMEDVFDLAAGYVDLLSAQPAPPVAESKASSPPPRVEVDAASVKDPALTAPTPPPVTRPTVTQPAVVYQALPPIPSSVSALRRTLKGAVRLVIGADGNVKSAAMSVPIHPEYDRLLLFATRSWRFRPATIDGMPVESERTIDVVLNAP